MNKYVWFVLLGFITITVFFISLSFKNKDLAVQVKLPKQFSRTAIEGGKLFNKNCMVCHGKYGSGTEKGPPLIHKYYEPNHHSDRSFFLAVKNGVRPHHWQFGMMPPIKGVTRSDVEKIIPYIREIQRENGIF
ncbi:MAG: cytochrome c [Rhizobiales bacterium]|nr:cytochrome c [Hyphomicrobiales bacterium]